MRLDLLLTALSAASLLPAAVTSKVIDTSPEQLPLDLPARTPTSKPKPVDLFQFHRELVEIESITGNEHAVGTFLAKYLESKGMFVHKQLIPTDLDPAEEQLLNMGDTEGEDQAAGKKKHKDKKKKKKHGKHGKKDPKAPRFNVYASFSKSAFKSRPRVILSSHIDTVPPYIPYETSSKEYGPQTLISGRGSVDAKASVAAQVDAALSLVAEGKVSKQDIALVFVTGEETGGDGMRTFSSSDLAGNITSSGMPTVIFGEPTQAKLVCGHKGLLSMRISTYGKASHSGYPWLGVSANEMMVRALAAVQGLVDDKNLPASEKYGATTVNVGLLNGGVARNVVAEYSDAGLGIRLAAGTPLEIANIIQTTVETAIQDLLAKGGRVEYAYDQGEGYGTVDIDCEGPEGFETMTVNYGTDVPNLKFDGRPYRRFLYGPGSIFVAHSAHEMLLAGDLYQAVEDYKKLILYSLENQST